MVTSGPWERRKPHLLPNRSSWEGYFRVGLGTVPDEIVPSQGVTLWKPPVLRLERSARPSVYDRPMRLASAGDVTAFVLAGGKSTRMGADKAFLEFEGRRLLDRALDLAQSVAAQVNIVGSAEKFGGTVKGEFARVERIVEDVFPDCGPLGGIHAALRGSQTDLNLMLAVDLPLIPSAFLQFLIAEVRKSPQALTVFAQAGGQKQNLCAIYRRGFADAAEKALRAGQNRIDALFTTVPVHMIGEEQLHAAGFSSSIFRNLNTPADLETAKHRFSQLEVNSSGGFRR
jgi:molybdenum cofactor guanylyltransferase